jgi:hypothetical protein
MIQGLCHYANVWLCPVGTVVPAAMGSVNGNLPPCGGPQDVNCTVTGVATAISGTCLWQQAPAVSGVQYEYVFEYEQDGSICGMNCGAGGGCGGVIQH